MAVQIKILKIDDVFSDANATITKDLMGRAKKKHTFEKVKDYLLKEFHVKEEDLRTFSHTLLAQGGLASKAMFTFFIDHLGPIVPDGTPDPDNQYWTLGQVADLYKQDWFHGNLKSAGVEYRLKNLPDKSWLVRFSSQAPRTFAISEIDQGNISQWVITPTKNPRNGREIVFAGYPRKYKDIFELVAIHQKENIPDFSRGLVNPCMSLDGKLEKVKHIGGGNFGQVYLATWHRPSGDSDVAAKILEEKNDEKKREAVTYDAAEGVVPTFSKEFEEEANMLKGMNHDNVVRFFGIARINEEQFIVTEFINQGSVLSFLQKKTKNDLTPLQITHMARDAAAGMAYLHERQIIHRDLAARNLLITEKDGHYIVKVTDFGLSRKVEGGKYYKKTGNHPDPVKWAAPETFKPDKSTDVFKGHVSERSDLWSYGIVLYELFTFCVADPYPNLNNTGVKGRLRDREEMTQHLPLVDCPFEVPQMMKDCLQYDSMLRPPFVQLKTRVDSIIKRLGEDSSANVWIAPEKPVDEEAEPKTEVPKDSTYGEGDSDPDTYDAQESEENKE